MGKQDNRLTLLTLLITAFLLLLSPSRGIYSYLYFALGIALLIFLAIYNFYLFGKNQKVMRSLLLRLKRLHLPTVNLPQVSLPKFKFVLKREKIELPAPTDEDADSSNIFRWWITTPLVPVTIIEWGLTILTALIVVLIYVTLFDRLLSGTHDVSLFYLWQ